LEVIVSGVEYGFLPDRPACFKVPGLYMRLMLLAGLLGGIAIYYVTKIVAKRKKASSCVEPFPRKDDFLLSEYNA
jgi:hypothetical protein